MSMNISIDGPSLASALAKYAYRYRIHTLLTPQEANKRFNKNYKWVYRVGAICDPEHGCFVVWKGVNPDETEEVHITPLSRRLQLELDSDILLQGLSPSVHHDWVWLDKFDDKIHILAGPSTLHHATCKWSDVLNGNPQCSESDTSFDWYTGWLIQHYTDDDTAFGVYTPDHVHLYAVTVSGIRSGSFSITQGKKLYWHVWRTWIETGGGFLLSPEVVVGIHEAFISPTVVEAPLAFATIADMYGAVVAWFLPFPQNANGVYRNIAHPMLVEIYGMPMLLGSSFHYGHVDGYHEVVLVEIPLELLNPYIQSQLFSYLDSVSEQVCFYNFNSARIADIEISGNGSYTITGKSGPGWATETLASGNAPAKLRILNPPSFICINAGGGNVALRLLR